MRESDGSLEFVALHFGPKLRIINPRGRVGIVTLWSKPEFVEQTLGEIGVDMNPETSKVAVIGNLYGNGLPHLLRNLLYNPQIRHLVICGANRGGSAEDLQAFFGDGMEKAIVLGDEVTKIKGRTRIIDDLVKPSDFAVHPKLVSVGDLRGKVSRDNLYKAVQAFEPGDGIVGDRLEVELPEVEVSHYPSEPRNHSIVKDSPLEAWRELIFRLVRFGHLVQLRKGDRQELQNVRVVVRNPSLDDAESLREYNFALDELIQYQHDMLLAPLPDDQPYTYGNRIREYYGFDALHKFAERLKANPEDRDCYLALWDSNRDIDADDAPCLVSMFFRVFDGKLTLTATYRTHNALDAWLKNVYGLMKAQEMVADEAGLEPGPITVISHSISIDPSKYDSALRVANAKGFSLEMDACGQFVITLEDEEIVVRHMDDNGVVMHEYRSQKAERIQYEMYRDCAMSDINHAMYIGRQLARAQICLRTGERFEEE